MASRPPRPSLSKRRVSAGHFSVDTLGTLPAYSSPPPTRQTHKWSTQDSIDDRPPDYPESESADEADEEGDFRPIRASRSPPTPRRTRYRRRESPDAPTSPTVDSLLERSVLALELSTNALLQSMATQSSLNAAFSADSPDEENRGHSSESFPYPESRRAQVRERWMDDMDSISRGVEGLSVPDHQSDEWPIISQSLPTSSSLLQRRAQRRASQKSSSSRSAFHLSSSELDLRDSLRPPRALTQYVSIQSAAGEASESTADTGSIYLPSTTGLRASAQVRPLAQANFPYIHASLSTPALDYHPAPTPAIDMLSHIVSRPSRPSRSPSPQRCRPSSSSQRKTAVRRFSGSSLDLPFKFPLPRRSHSASRSRSTHSESSTVTPTRNMTPPLEESTPESSESSLGKAGAFRTMESLRKILDDSPRPSMNGQNHDEARDSPRKKHPAFQPRTPLVTATAGTSTATASVSRLLTRNHHHSSSSSSHRPRHSNLKQSLSVPSSPVPEASGRRSPASKPSSGRNTPRVSFARLPESYSGSKESSTPKSKKGKHKLGLGETSWWMGWVGNMSGQGATKYEERLESRGQWGRMGVGGPGGSLEDWTV